MLNGSEGRTNRLPKKILGFVLALSGILLVLWLFVATQAEYGSSEKAPDERISRVFINADTTGRLTPYKINDTASEPSGLFGGAGTIFLILVGILGAAYLWFKKYDTLSIDYFDEIGRQQLSLNQELIVLEVNGEVWVLAAGSESVSLLHTCDKEEWKQVEKKPIAGNNFKKLFDGLAMGKQWNGNNQ